MPHPTYKLSIKQKVFWHLRLSIAAIAITLIFSFVLRRKIIHPELPQMFVMVMVQLEVFVWLGTLFFQSIKVEEPKYAQKIVLRLLLFYISVLVLSFLLFMGIYTFHFVKNGAPFSLYFSSLTSMELKSFFLATLIGFAIGAIFFFYTQWYEALQRMQKLKEEKLIFQYETLKNQVNPHFLFNSLNTLSSLVSQNIELSEKFIQKLSSVYRYVLENQEKELVSVTEEINFVKDFFYLQKIRDGEKISLEIEFNHDRNEMIMPVSIQMLVENAIKHNSATRNNPLLISIHFEGIDKVVVRNPLQKKMQLSNSSKIGLKNLNERSRLILNREIEISETVDEFVVKVPVQMT